MITANAMANATFMVVVNRIGVEGPLTFHGSSFIADPHGRVVVEAPATNRRSWSPTSTSTSAATGSSSGFSPPDDPSNTTA